MCFDEESILHIACGVIFSKIQCGEHVPVILNFRTLGNTETQTCKYIDDFVFYDGERVACTQFYRISGTSEVNIVTTRILAFELFFQGVNLFLRLVFQFIQSHADFFLLFGSHVAEVCHQVIDSAFFTEEFDAECFQFLGVGSFQCFHFLQKLVDFIYHIVVIIYFRNT